MRCFTPLFAASVALLAAEAATAELQAAVIPTSEGNGLQVRGFMLGQNGNPGRRRGGRASSPLSAAVCVLTIAAVIFLAIQCFKTIHSNTNSRTFGLNGRRLAEGGQDPCGVGHGHQMQGVDSVQGGPCRSTWS